MDKKQLISAAIAGVIALGSNLALQVASAADTGKCWGAKASKNDCGNSKHGCGGQAKADPKTGKLPADEWATQTKEQCEKDGGKWEPTTK